LYGAQVLLRLAERSENVDFVVGKSALTKSFADWLCLLRADQQNGIDVCGHVQAESVVLFYLAAAKFDHARGDDKSFPGRKLSENVDGVSGAHRVRVERVVENQHVAFLA